MNRVYSTQDGLTVLARGKHDIVIGVDEVGYGSWAGPVVVCATAAPASWNDSRVRDSKQIKTREHRRFLAEEVIPPHVRYSMLQYDNQVIDRMGITRARDDLVKHAVANCVQVIGSAKYIVVMDGNVIPRGLPEQTMCFPKADAHVRAVSAASLLAKVFRDNLMQDLAEEHPWYDFCSNVGYGTEAHQAGLDEYGPCAIHRMSYRNINDAFIRFLRHRRALAKLREWRPLPNETRG